MHIREASMRGLLRLLGEAYELSPVPGAAQQHVMRGILAMIGGVGVVKLEVYDYCRGGGRDIRGGRHVGFDDTFQIQLPVVDRYLDDASEDPSVPRFLETVRAERGAAQAFRRSDLVDNASWYESAYVSDVRRASRIDDSIYTGVCHGGTRGEGAGIYRAWGDAPFTDEDRDLMLIFHAEVLARFSEPDGELSAIRLSPRERQTLDALFRGTRRKDIAAELGISLNTVNEYIKVLYRRLGVSGLPELFARFRPGRRAPL